MRPLSERDLNHVLEHTSSIWEDLKGERLFITGGTGFFGCWLLESFLWANQQFSLGARATVLSRSPRAFLEKMPHLKNQASLDWVEGDVTNFEFPDGNFKFVIHAATEASAKLSRENPGQMFDTIVDGTRHTLDFAETHGVKKYLLTSSGAVYGRQPSDLPRLPEDFTGAPNCLNAADVYGEGKRAAEMLCAIAGRDHHFDTKIARCFAFVGPHLPLDAHFAIGNFIHDGMNGGPILIKGDGTPCRSYLYAADLAIWLWTILFNGGHLRPYNVGSGESVSIIKLADITAEQFTQKIDVQILETHDPQKPLERYVPDVTRAEEELGLEVWVSLKESIRRTIEYYI